MNLCVEHVLFGFFQTSPRQLLFHQKEVLDVSLINQLLRTAVLSPRRELLSSSSRRLGAVVSVLFIIAVCAVISFAV